MGVAVHKNVTAASATLTLANDALTVDVTYAADVTVACTSADWGATTEVTFEVTIDGTNWVSLAMLNTLTTTHATRAVSALADGTFVADVAAFKKFRARLSTVDAGPVAVKVFESDQGYGHFSL